MNLVYQDIMKYGPHMVQPFQKELVNPASYDITLGSEALIRGNERVQLPFELMPGEFILVTSEQKWDFPCDVAGQLLLKSTVGRQGLDHMLAGWFDPDFHGDATMELVNNGHCPYMLKPGARIAQMVFARLSQPTEMPYRYSGRYQGQSSVTPPRPSRSGSNDSRPLWVTDMTSYEDFRSWRNMMSGYKIPIELKQDKVSIIRVPETQLANSRIY